MNKKLIAILLILPMGAIAYPQGIEIVPTNHSLKMARNAPVNNNYAKKLLNIEAKENHNLTSKKYYSDVYDTHIKKHLAPIKLNFKFNGLKTIDPKNVIGYAPMGAYNDGWTGITQYFKDKELGVCTYSINRIVYVRISSDIASRNVNNKITTTHLEGNKDDGFLYTVSWYEDKGDKNVIDKEIECANMIYGKEILGKIIALANRIDKE